MQNNEVNQLGGVANQIESTRDNPQRYRVYSPLGISPALNTAQGGGLSPYWLVKSSQRERERVVRLAYDDKDECLYSEPTIGGSITTRIGATGCSWKVLEIRVKK